MTLYNLYLVLNNEPIKVYDNAKQSFVYEGSSVDMPEEIMDEIVHDMTIVKTNRTYFLININ